MLLSTDYIMLLARLKIHKAENQNRRIGVTRYEIIFRTQRLHYSRTLHTFGLKIGLHILPTINYTESTVA